MAMQHEKHSQRINVDEFSALVVSDPKHRYELIDGYPRMMTGGSPDHSLIGASINRILGNELRRGPCMVYNSDACIKLNDDINCLCPDASVSCDRRDRHATKLVRYPCVVAEVLSPGTKARDRGSKAKAYQEMPSVQEILFIETHIMRVQLYRRERDGWTIHHFMHDETVTLTSLDIHFPVAELYEKTTFDQTFMDEE
jgi:Uma2 family endonuclease